MKYICSRVNECGDENCKHHKPHNEYGDCDYDGYYCKKCIPVIEDFLSEEEFEI